MTIFITKKSKGYTLLEILLAIGLGAILTLAAVPALEGWRAEYRLRTQAGKLIEMVQKAKIAAEKEGRRQVVVLSSRSDNPFPGAGRAGVHCFSLDSGYRWQFLRFDGSEEERQPPMIAIDARGRVEPVSFRVRVGGRFVEYRFDFLSGHAKEEEASL